MNDRPFDLVIFGATGFTGRLAAGWLKEHAPDGLRWTVAGRRAAALAALCTELGLDAEPIIADVNEADSIDALAASTRVLITTAGPFSKYGTPVVAACVKHGTHYADITGESPWVADMIRDFHDTARAQGTRLVPFSGFDSVPSDLGTWWVVQQVRERLEQGTRSVTAAFSMRGGGLNGGTLASGLELAERYPRKALADPFLLVPGKTSREQWSANKDPSAPVQEPDTGRWLAPFVMGAVNTRVVRRAAHLAAQAGHPYGEHFTYQEYADVRQGKKLRAQVATLGLGLAGGLLASGFGRGLLRRFGPKPGQGPSEQAREGASFRVRYRAEADDGTALRAEMNSPGDAGNASTVRMLCCVGLCLALDQDTLGFAEGNGGVLPPSVAVGTKLLERLRAHGMTLEIVDGPPHV